MTLSPTLREIQAAAAPHMSTETASVTYLRPPGATSGQICHIADGQSSMSLCARFLPGWGRSGLRPGKVCGQCQRALRRRARAAKAEVRR